MMYLSVTIVNPLVVPFLGTIRWLSLEQIDLSMLPAFPLVLSVVRSNVYQLLSRFTEGTSPPRDSSQW